MTTMSTDDWLSEDRKKQLLAEGWQPPPERRWLLRGRMGEQLQFRRVRDQKLGGGEWDAVIFAFLIGFIGLLAFYFFM